MPGTNEAFSRVKIDAQLKDQGWDVVNPNAVRFEYVLPDKTKADYVLCDRHGRALAVIEAKRASINPARPKRKRRPTPRSSTFLTSSSPTARRSASGSGCWR